MLQSCSFLSHWLKLRYDIKVLTQQNVVLLAPDPEEPHEMGDVEKMEMTEEESDAFDEKRNEAMTAFSDAEW